MPRELARKLNIGLGDKVEPYLVDHSFAYRPIKQTGRKVSAEFEAWLAKFAKKYDRALTELAKK